MSKCLSFTGETNVWRQIKRLLFSENGKKKWNKKQYLCAKEIVDAVEKYDNLYQKS